MKLSDLIKQATDILAAHGNLVVDVELQDYRVVKVKQLDIVREEIYEQGWKAVVVADKKSK